MIDILIPVLGRGEQIEPLLQNLHATTKAEYRVVLICTPGDEATEVAKSTEADVIVVTWEAGYADYAKKLAVGFRYTEEPWLFQGATDLIFKSEWDTQALRVAKQTHKRVIGTNDLSNPQVRRGEHSTHTLIARSYIEEFGGTCDGTGIVFSEAYDHQYSDNEFIETAKRRREFAFAARSIVEHRHPHWGTAKNDPTYEKAMRATKRDMKLFMARRRKFVRTR